MTTTESETDTPKTERTPEERDAARREVAWAGYEMLTGILAELAKRPDETSAKNYVAMVLEGFAVGPFDRVELHFARPGGLTPVQRAEGLAVMVDQLRADLREAREERHNTFIANSEIAIELTDRITGATPIDTEERFNTFVRAMESAGATLREKVRVTDAQNAVMLAMVKEAMSALTASATSGALDDHGKSAARGRCAEAIANINTALEAAGVVL